MNDQILKIRKRSFFDEDEWREGTYADEVFVQERETHSPVLGPNGEPLQYEDPDPVGFDLRRAALKHSAALRRLANR